MDFGAKKNIARSLNNRGCEVTIYPAHTSAEEIIASQSGRHHVIQWPWGSGRLYDLLSKRSRNLSETDIPIFAICLGHQLMALATWR